MEEWVSAQHSNTPSLREFAMADRIRFIYKAT
jgi:hypothetical protein